MVTEKIKYKYNRSFLGRNGNFSVSGLEITSVTGGKWPFILIEPTTSKGLTGRCFIEIPKENIPDLIKALEKMI